MDLQTARTVKMSVVPLLSKRTHLRSPTAAAFLRSKGVSRGFGVVLAMSVPACTVIMLVMLVRDTAIAVFPWHVIPVRSEPCMSTHEWRQAIWVAPETALRKPTTGLGGVLSLVVSLRRASFDNSVLRLGMPFFSLVIAGHPNLPHGRAGLVQFSLAEDCNLHTILFIDCLESAPSNTEVRQPNPDISPIQAKMMVY